jgi:predicted Zn-dependent protease
MQNPGGRGVATSQSNPIIFQPIKRALRSRTLMKTFVTSLLCLLGLLAPLGGFSQSDDSAEKSQRAKEFMAEGKFADAVPLYRELNLAVPNNPGLLLNLGMALHLAGDDHKSIHQLEAAVKLDPKLAPAWLFLGAARLQLGQAPSAIQAVHTVLSLQPDHPGALEILGAALLSLDRAAESAEQYRKLADVDPESAPAWYGLGRSYESLAVRAFDDLQKAAPESAYWLALVAETRLREQQLSSAFYLYRNALEKMPAIRGLHAQVAEVYRRSGHPDWASLEEEKERQLPEPDCHTQTLECEFRDGQFLPLLASAKGAGSPESYYWRSRAYNELALQAFARLGQLPPSMEQHELKAHIFSGQKRYAEAAQEWREARKLSPLDKQIQKQLAVSLKFSQDYAGALPLFQVLLHEQPASAELNYLTGETLLDLQQPQEAIPLLLRAVNRDPQLIAAHKALARAYLAAGKAREAIPHLKASLAADQDGSLHYQLARAYQATGQPGLAKEMLADYQKSQRSTAATTEEAARDVEITPP